MRSGALVVEVVTSILSQSFPKDIREHDQLLRRLFLVIVRGFYLGNNSSTIHYIIVKALRDVDHIGTYDWGSFTFAFFLRGMRFHSKGQMDA